jgi:hypothetical protein
MALVSYSICVSRLSVTPASREDPAIRIELRRGVTTVNVAWPLAAAGECSVWLRELLK